MPNAQVCVYLMVHTTKSQLQTTVLKLLYIPQSARIHGDPGTENLDVCTACDPWDSNVYLILYIITNMVCVRPTTFWERLLWRNRPQRFSPAEPARTAGFGKQGSENGIRKNAIRKKNGIQKNGIRKVYVEKSAVRRSVCLAGQGRAGGRAGRQGRGQIKSTR
jgi:hypothetical protein